MIHSTKYFLITLGILFGMSIFAGNRAEAACAGWCSTTTFSCSGGDGGVCLRCKGVQCHDCNAKCESLGYIYGGTCVTGGGGGGMFMEEGVEGGTDIGPFVDIGNCPGINTGNCECATGGGGGGMFMDDQHAEAYQEDVYSDPEASWTDLNWGYRDNVNKSGSGVSNACRAKLHACFTNGYADANFSTLNACNNECADLSTPTNVACTTTQCQSRCNGWFNTTSCN